MKTFPLLTVLALLINQAFGATYDDHHFLLDQSLSKEQTDQSPYLFSDVTNLQPGRSPPDRRPDDCGDHC